MARFELIGDNTYVNVDYISHIVQDKFGVATVTMQDGSAFKIKNKEVPELLGMYSVKAVIPVKDYEAVMDNDGKNVIHNIPFMALTEAGLLRALDETESYPRFYDGEDNFKGIRHCGDDTGWGSKG